MDLTQIKQTQNIAKLSDLIWNVILEPLDPASNNKATTSFREITGAEPTDENIKIFFQTVVQQCKQLGKKENCGKYSEYKDNPNRMFAFYSAVDDRDKDFANEYYFKIYAIAEFYLGDYKKAASYAGKLSDWYHSQRHLETDYFHALYSLIAYISISHNNGSNSSDAKHYLDNYDAAYHSVGSGALDSLGFMRIYQKLSGVNDALDTRFCTPEVCMRKHILILCNGQSGCFPFFDVNKESVLIKKGWDAFDKKGKRVSCTNSPLAYYNLIVDCSVEEFQQITPYETVKYKVIEDQHLIMHKPTQWDIYRQSHFNTKISLESLNVASLPKETFELSPAISPKLKQ